MDSNKNAFYAFYYLGNLYWIAMAYRVKIACGKAGYWIWFVVLKEHELCLLLTIPLIFWPKNSI